MILYNLRMILYGPQGYPLEPHTQSKYLLIFGCAYNTEYGAGSVIIQLTIKLSNVVVLSNRY